MKNQVENSPGNVRLRLSWTHLKLSRAGDPNSSFDRWVETLKRAGVEAKQIAIAENGRQHGYNPIPHQEETKCTYFFRPNVSKKL
jgi:hypothetical protein